MVRAFRIALLPTGGLVLKLQVLSERSEKVTCAVCGWESKEGEHSITT